jgi:zinc transport system permease protein
MIDFIVRALVAGLCVAVVSGPLGCFVVWRRMAYFGDTLAHAALLGIAFGLMADINLHLAVTLACLMLAVTLVLMERSRHLATDTILGILAHSSLAFGLVILSFAKGPQVDLMSYLFGDLLTVSRDDLYWVMAGTALVLGAMVYYWKPLLTITLHAELAQVEGLPVERLRLVLMLLIAVVVAVAMKIVGILLITSLLIIPPACARPFARNPESMAMMASVAGCVAVVLGMLASFYLDTPTGPSIVAAAGCLFVLASLTQRQSA